MSNLSHYWYYLHFTQFRLSLETYNTIQCTQLAKCTFIYTTPNILTWVRRYNRTLWTYVTQVIKRRNTSLKLQLISKRLLFAQRYTLHLMFALWLICKLYVYDMKINTRIYIWKLVYTVPVLSVYLFVKKQLNWWNIMKQFMAYKFHTSVQHLTFRLKLHCAQSQVNRDNDKCGIVKTNLTSRPNARKWYYNLNYNNNLIITW